MPLPQGRTSSKLNLPDTVIPYPSTTVAQDEPLTQRCHFELS